MQDDVTQKRGKPFVLGNRSGKGRPTGSRNKVTLACEELLEGAAKEITLKVIEMALEGAPFAVKLCMERIYPPRRERRLKLDLPEILTVDDLRAAHATVVKEMALGNITPTEAARVTSVLEFRRLIETEDLARGWAEVRAELEELKESYERRAA